MKRTNVLISRRSFERRVKARLEQIKIWEADEKNTESSEKASDTFEINYEDYSDDEVCSEDVCDCGKPYVLQHIPTDARSLLKTPAKVAIEDVYPGKFWRSGLTNNLLQLLKCKHCPKTLKLMVSVDGVKPYKSSVKEFWPVQCAVDEVEMEPFFVRIWYGEGKPPLEDFLRPLVDELKMLLDNGLTCSETGETFDVQVFMFVCDAPARAYVKCIKDHAGYFPCERCTTEGEYLSDHVCLVSVDSSLRNNFSFRSREQSEHHWATSPLEELPIDMVSDFPLDYLHLVLLGVMKMLITFWTKGTATCMTKFSSLDISQISSKILQARDTQPSDINRKCRRLSCFSFWKGTEFGTMLLKTGADVLQGHLTAAAYNHFLSLHCAITILTSKSLLQYANVAKVLLKDFVERFDEIYGNERLTYNVHSLIHVVDDVVKYGPLHLHSAFRYETNLGVLKSLLRSGNRPLEQVAKRLLERQYMFMMLPVKPTNIPKEFPYLSMCRDAAPFPTYRKLFFKHTHLDSSDRNCWMLTKADNIVKVQYFSQGKSGILIHGIVLNKKKSNQLVRATTGFKELKHL